MTQSICGKAISCILCRISRVCIQSDFSTMSRILSYSRKVLVTLPFPVILRVYITKTHARMPPSYFSNGSIILFIIVSNNLITIKSQYRKRNGESCVQHSVRWITHIDDRMVDIVTKHHSKMMCVLHVVFRHDDEDLTYLVTPNSSDFLSPNPLDVATAFKKAAQLAPKREVEWTLQHLRISVVSASTIKPTDVIGRLKFSSTYACHLLHNCKITRKIQ